MAKRPDSKVWLVRGPLGSRRFSDVWRATLFYKKAGSGQMLKFYDNEWHVIAWGSPLRSMTAIDAGAVNAGARESAASESAI